MKRAPTNPSSNLIDRKSSTCRKACRHRNDCQEGRNFTITGPQKQQAQQSAHGHVGKHQGQSENGVRRNHGQEPLLRFLWKEQEKQVQEFRTE